MLVLGLEDPRWAAFVKSRPEAGPFHHPSWARLLSDCYGFPAFILARETPNGRLAAGLPVLEVRSPFGSRRWLSLPFTDACPPLATNVDERAALAPALDEHRRRAGLRTLEVRGELGGPNVHPRRAAFTHALALERDPETLFRRLHRSQVQRNVRRAEAEGIRIRRGRRADLLGTFYALHLQTRRRQGTPVQPRRFFRLLWERLLATGLGYLSIAETEQGRPVAGAVFLGWNRTVVYKYGASDPAFWKLRPNHALFWDAIRTAAEQGALTFDFGRTDPDNAGLRQFKSGWGAEENELVYSTLADAAPALARGITRGALAAVIRRSPRGICRVTGELLYKYAA